MSFGTVQAEKITTESGYSLGAGNASSFKNRIINGAMVIDQRNAGSATTNAINGYVVDRWQVNQSTTGKLIAQQNAGSVTLPIGFTKYLGVTSQSAYSIGASDYYLLQQPIEGVNVADLGWGTASAKTVTLSFQVRSSLVGTFGGVISNNDANRSYPFTYTISSANTWETKTVSIAGDTSGNWLTTNGIGMFVRFGLGVGSAYSGTDGSWAGAVYLSATGATSVVGTNGATFYITGVQFEVGTVATSFDFRSYGTELALCQRYCYVPLQGTMANAAAFSSTRFDAFMQFPVTMRATPAGSYTVGSTYYRVYLGGTSSSFSTLLTNGINANGVLMYSTSISGVSTGAGGWLETQSAPYGAIVFSAEL